MTTDGVAVSSAAPNAAPVARDFAARFLAEGMGLLLGTISSIVTARWLGPADKGTLSTLMFLTVVLIPACLLGLGDAATVLVGQRKATFQQALSASLGVAGLTSFVGAALIAAYALVELPTEQSYVTPAVVLACATVVVGVLGQLFLYSAYVRAQIVVLSWVVLAVSAVTTAGTVLFVAVLNLSVMGGMLASLVGVVVALVWGLDLARRNGLRPTVRWDRGYLRRALPFGARTQFANVLAFSAARLDLLLVFSITGQAAAGRYSVALTLGTAAGAVALALSYATFPRIAQLDDEHALATTAWLVRAGLLLSAALAVVVSVALPWLVEVTLGRAYGPAVGPARLLLVGNVLWSGQWILSRALAARGDPSLLFRSFAANLSTMLVLDALLIPMHGEMGAAVASVVAPAVGLWVCVLRYHRRGAALRVLVPRPADVTTLARSMQRFWDRNVRHRGR